MNPRVPYMFTSTELHLQSLFYKKIILLCVCVCSHEEVKGTPVKRGFSFYDVGPSYSVTKLRS